MKANTLSIYPPPSCWVLDEPKVGDRFIIPTGTVRDEGTSYHYLAPEEELLLKRAKAEDSLSEKAGRMDAVFLDMMEKLACGMISFVNGFNPQKITIGHEGFWIPDHYLKVLEAKVNERHIARKYRNVQVTKSHFEADAALRGCASSLLTAIFEGQLFYQ